MTAMIADVLSSVLDSKQDMDMTINPTHVMAPQERLSQVTDHFSNTAVFTASLAASLRTHS